MSSHHSSSVICQSTAVEGQLKLLNDVTGHSLKRKVEAANIAVEAAPTDRKYANVSNFSQGRASPPGFSAFHTGLPSVALTGYAYTVEEFIDGEVTLSRLVLAELPISGGGRHLDVGAGIKVSSNPAIYLLRKEMFSVRSKYKAEASSLEVDDLLTHDSICIDGKEHTIVLNADPNCKYCLAVNSPVDFHASYDFRATESSLTLEVITLCAPWCAHVAPQQYCKDCHHVSYFDVSLERFVGGGRLLWEGGCGGVWAGHLRDKNERNAFNFNAHGMSEPVVVKRFLHVAKFSPSTTSAANTDAAIDVNSSSSSVQPVFGPTQYSLMRSNVDRSRTYKVFRFASHQVHNAANGIRITSADLAGGFVMKDGAGGKENPMREVELMAHIARVFPNHAEYFSALRGFGASATDLYVLTKELDSSNLYNLMLYHKLLLTEGQVKVFMKRILYSLRMLHSRRIAHWDIKAENTAFRIKPEIKNYSTRTALLKKLRVSSEVPAKKRLTADDLLRLDAMLIDFGQAVWDLPQATTIFTPDHFGADAGSHIPSSTPSAPATVTPSFQQSQTSPRGVEAVGNVSPVPAPAPGPWLRAMAAGKSPPGNAHSMAPEHSDFVRDGRITQSIVIHPEKVDMWQVGLLMYYMLFGRHLLKLNIRSDERENFFRNPQCIRNELETTSANHPISSECAELLLDLLRLDPSARVDVHTALRHRWFTS